MFNPWNPRAEEHNEANPRLERLILHARDELRRGRSEVECVSILMGSSPDVEVHEAINATRAASILFEAIASSFSNEERPTVPHVRR